MVPTTELERSLTELKAKLQEGKAVLGTAIVKKKIQSGVLEKAFLARNCPETVKQDVAHFAGLSNIPVEQLELDNEELGVFCKKGFFVSVLGTVK